MGRNLDLTEREGQALAAVALEGLDLASPGAKLELMRTIALSEYISADPGDCAALRRVLHKVTLAKRLARAHKS